MITRTVKYTKVVVAVLKDDLTVEKVERTIPGKFDAKGAAKYLTKNNIDFAKVLSVESADILTGMSEEDWLKYCKPIDSRYVKVEDR